MRVLPIEGAVEGLKNLSKNYKIHIVTARPQNVRPQTLRWVEQHLQGIIVELHLASASCGTDEADELKSSICKRIKADIFIDDALHNVYDVAQSGIPTFLYDQPWNQVESPLNITRVRSWAEIQDLLTA